MSYFNTIKREWERLTKSKLGCFISFFFPIIMCFLICLIFSAETPKDLPVAVWNADNSQLSRALVRNINTLQSCKVVYQLTNFEEGNQLLKEGKIYGFIVIPKNFQRDVYRMTQPQLVFYYNNQRLLIGGTISKDITLMSQSLIVGLDAKIKNKKGMPFKEAIKQSNLINVVEHTRANPYFNYMYLITLTAIGHILQMSMVLTSVWAIGTEFKHGTTKEWLKTADNSIIQAFLGKLTVYFLLYSIIFFIVYLLCFGICQIPVLGNWLLIIIATLLFTIACLSLGAVFMSINGNLRYCLSGAIFYVAIGFALAGITFPLMAMPLVIKIYAHTMPLTYWAQIIIDQTIRKIPYIYDIKLLLPFLIVIIISFIALYRLKKLALDEKRWYQL